MKNTPQENNQFVLEKLEHTNLYKDKGRTKSTRLPKKLNKCKYSKTNNFELTQSNDKYAIALCTNCKQWTKLNSEHRLVNHYNFGEAIINDTEKPYNS